MRCVLLSRVARDLDPLEEQRHGIPSAMRTRIVASTAIAALALAVAIGAPIGAPSERFWLVWPAAVAAFAVAWAPDPAARAAVVARWGLGLLAALAGGVWLLGAISSQVAFPIIDGAWRAADPVEALVGAWYLAGLAPIAVGGWLALRGAVARWVAARRGPFDPSAPPLVVQILPIALAVPVLAPVLLASLFVHRPKLPNAASPPDATTRTAYDEVAFETRDGLTIRGWFLPAAEASARTVLIGHGLSANRAMFLPFTAIGDALGANVLLFDLRGHGDSDGHTVTFGCREHYDVLAAVDWLRTQQPDRAQWILGVGISLSSAAFLQAAAALDDPFDGLVIDSGFTAPVDIATDALQPIPEGIAGPLVFAGLPIASLEAGCWLPRVRPIDALARARAPVLFAHARGDPLIPASHSVALHARALPPKALHLSDTRGHALSLVERPGPYLDRVRALFVEAP